jgi:hypothetical protein
VIEEFDRTYHALRRVSERKLDRFEIEMTIRSGHAMRRPNAGDADWRVEGERMDGTRFQVVYDHPVHAEADADCVRVVSVWRIDDEGIF